MLKGLLPRRHPPYDTLSLLADGELRASDAMAVNAHLAECRECREEVDFMVDLRGRLQALAGPPPPRNTLPEILGARAMGERRVLDFSEEPRHRPGRAFARTAAPVAAVVTLVAVSFALFGAGSVEAGRSSLEFDMAAAGEPIGLEYHTSGSIAAAPEATAVARTYGRYDPYFFARPRPVEAPLVPRSVGTFAGSMTLPSTISFARFDVRAPGGLYDPAGRAMFVARRSDGKPTFDALANMIQFQLEAGEPPDGEALRQLTELYGDNPYAWSLRYWVERDAGLLTDSALRHYVDRLEELGQDLENESANQVGAILAYANALSVAGGSSTAVRMIRDRAVAHLREVAPSHPELVGTEALDVMIERWGEPGARLAAAEDLWIRHGQGTVELYQLGLNSAVETGDGAAIVRWIDRWLSADGGAAPDIAAVITGALDAPYSASRPAPELIDKLGWLIGEYERIGRPLPSASPREQGAYRAEVADLLELQARLLREAGRPSAAYEALTAAVESEWSAPRMRELAVLADELGLSRESAEARARALVLSPDSETRAELESALDGAPLPRAEVDAIRAGAMAEARTHLFTPDPIRPAGALEVRDLFGRLVEFHPGEGPATLVYFWESAYPATTLDVTTTLVAACQELAAAGVSVRIIADREPDSAMLESLEAGPCDYVVLIDGRKHLRRAYDAPLMKQALVLDPEGALYFRGDDLSAAMLRARILAEGL